MEAAERRAEHDCVKDERAPRTVSVALAVFNGEKYIKEQLDSILSQTHKPDEVVICDDRSTDATVARCESFRQAAPFRVDISINVGNLGATKNFENVIRKCSGDIVFLSDQDDVWLPHKIATIKELFERHPGVLAISNDAIICDESLTSTKFTKLEQTLAIGRPEYALITGCCSAFRRKFLEIALPIPKAAPAHDNWLNGLANRLSARMICREALQYYRRHETNESHDISSRAKRLSHLSLIKQYGLRDARSGWRDAIAETQAYLDRMKSVESEIRALGLSVDLDKVLNDLSRKIVAIRNRLEIAERPRPRRVLPILTGYVNGDYFYFRGIKSAVKDIIRP